MTTLPCLVAGAAEDVVEAAAAGCFAGTAAGLAGDAVFAEPGVGAFVGALAGV
ncbi:MAG TPA: hypothetical protein VE621_18160 [Bryobacteraceae bacterium]|nr:hypothetical protein [Bryobacteraceae bacterium]